MRSKEQKKGLIFVISGPSGSGKTTLLRHLLQDRELRGKLVKSVSLTTRPKRSGELDKRDYFFISRAQFLRERKAKKLLEWTKYLGYYYATPKGFIERQLNKSRHVVLCLDLSGALKIKRKYPKQAVTIFIMPPSQRALLHRITMRCNKTKEQEIKGRLQLAKQELSVVNRYDYCLMNKDLRQAVKQLKKIIIEETGSLY